MPAQQQQQQQQPPSSIPLDTSFLPGSAPGPTSPQLEKDAARAMSSTSSWKPAYYERKQSYHKEDQKHEMQMRGLADGGKPGFSEGGSA